MVPCKRSNHSSVNIVFNKVFGTASLSTFATFVLLKQRLTTGSELGFSEYAVKGFTTALIFLFGPTRPLFLVYSL